MIAETFSVRRAEGPERRLLTRLLLPRSGELDADVFAATAIEEADPIGAAALWFSPSRRFPERAECVVHVLERNRRRGIGRALLDSAAAMARDIGARQLRTAPLDEKSIGYQFFRACGFEAGPPTITSEATIENFARVLRPTYERMQQRGKIPKNARVIPLSEASREEVCRLVLNNLGFSSQQAAQRLRGTPDGYSQTISQVALLDNKMVGAVLISYQKALAVIDATAVLPDHRHTWVNIALKCSAMDILIARGVERIRFSANSIEHPDTTKIALRTNARVLKTVRLATLDLD